MYLYDIYNKIYQYMLMRLNVTMSTFIFHRFPKN